MKSLINKIIAGIVLVSIGACSLEEEPYGIVTSDQFYQTEEDVRAALAHAYDALSTIEYYGRYLYYVGVLGTEEFTLKADAQPADHELDNWNPIGTNLVLSSVYFNAYMGINRVNLLLSRVDESIPMIDEERNQILGEAQFLRALHHFNLVRVFGEVPMRDTPILSVEDIPKAKSTIADLYAFIEKDLLAAELMMKDIDPGDLISKDARATKVSAQALLAKVYLHQASSSASGAAGYEYVVDANEYYDNAALYAEKVLNNSAGYEFWSETNDYKSLWDVDNQVGNEFIFSIGAQVSGGENGNDWSSISMLQVPALGGTTIEFGADNVSISDGWGHLTTEIPFYNQVFGDRNDLRSTDLIVDEVTLLDGTISTYPGNLPYPFTLKYIDKGQQADRSNHYLPVIRYTDIALVYAEASGPTTEAYDWVNRIRNRATVASERPNNLVSGLSTEEFREEVFMERTKELAFEGERLFDLRRTNKVREVLEGQYGKIVGQYADFYEIPQNEQDLNSLIE
ncbi:RagB/SusD family nutrient uptake outer membrane protein [Reichenbachiella versicolor]|uniref:RagB/SusD family nutrient uptake outer membrane protein n=1 Tax=Reichenbachiella versicolor TaxID=1821036 RepID=UPI000D6E28BE|nr:RagB/SusD family nutrient uptake outer membrane protein [Reichenbachiella versicolor]